MYSGDKLRFRTAKFRFDEYLSPSLGTDVELESNTADTVSVRRAGPCLFRPSNQTMRGRVEYFTIAVLFSLLNLEGFARRLAVCSANALGSMTISVEVVEMKCDLNDFFYQMLQVV